MPKVSITLKKLYLAGRAFIENVKSISAIGVGENKITFCAVSTTPDEKIYGFDYAQYLHFQSVFGIAFLRENAYEIIPQKPSFSLETYASKVRQQLQFQ